MKYLSLFSGIGGFELGITQAYENNKTIQCSAEQLRSGLGDTPIRNSTDSERKSRENYTCIGFSEIDKYAVQIYQKHFNHKNYGDITQIKENELPDFDFLCGGFPCQSFSIAGKRGGFNDTRGTMFFHITRILKVKQPRLLLLENVKGLLSHDEGRTFATIIATLDELGYDLQWQVLNSKNFGVPQNRERVFIVGHLRGTSRPKVFPFGNTNNTTDQRFEPGDTESEVASTLRSRYGNGSGSHIVPTIRATQYKSGDNQTVVAIPVLTPDRLEKRQNGRRFKEDGEPSFTLTGQDKHGVSDGIKIRRLTPTECERLQGFPDGWTEGVSDTQRYKTLGNAVTVNVIREIIKKLL